MMKNILQTLKPFVISLIILAFGYATIAFAAPYFRQEASLVPIDSTENIGTSTNRWAEGWFGSIDVSGTCTGCGGAGTFPFTVQSYGVSTSTTVAFLNGLIGNAASSTITNLFVENGTTTNATSTNLYVSGDLWAAGLTSALTLTGADGKFAEYAGTSCTNQFVRSLSALGAATCATVGASDVSLANLTATDGTLTFSGTYNGSTARTIGLNLGNANTWTAVQQFNANASTTQLSAYSAAYFGATATSTFTSTGALGISSSTPWALLSINANALTSPAFNIGSSTGSYFTVNQAGGIELSATQPATTTAITLDWENTPPQVEYRIGGSATTITIINATTSRHWGSTKRVWVCNPGGTAGAVTWVGVEWIGTAPTQTTTADKCDLWSFNITKATSSTAYKVAGAATTGFQ